MEFSEAFQRIDSLCLIAAQEIVSITNGDSPMTPKYEKLQGELRHFDLGLSHMERSFQIEQTHQRLVWAIVSALRGPDCDCKGNPSDDCFKVKSSTTARIRAVIGLTTQQFIEINHHKLQPDQIEQRDRRLYHQMPMHFVTHIREAVAALMIIGLWEDWPVY